MSDARIPILDLGPEIEQLRPALDAAWQRVLESHQFIMGPEVDAFEREAAAFLGARNVVAVNSGTDALAIALRALGVGPGDEVITVSFTFFATAEAVTMVGARPVFVDIDAATFTLRPETLEAARTARTKAVLPVHLFGQAAEMAPIQAFARAHGLAVVEDAAQAFGGRYQGNRLGTIGTVGAFSFFPSKNLGCMGDGGLIATDDGQIADAARMLRVHGARRKYFNEVAGYNSRLDALQAAILRAKLPHVEGWNEARRRAAGRYREMLAGLGDIVLPSERGDGVHVYHQFTVRVQGGRRDALRDWLAVRGIGTMVYYPIPVHRMPLYASSAGACLETEAASQEVLSLPLWPQITPETQSRVVSEIRAFLGRA